MLQRMGKSGPFLGCSGYPECKTTMNFDAEGKPVLSAKPTEHTCEKCGKPMVIREGRRGPFLACTGYPKCKNAKDVDADGQSGQADRPRASPARSAARRWRSRRVRAVRSWAARPIRSAAAPSRAGGAEGKAQGTDAGAGAEEGHSGGRGDRHLSEVRRADETASGAARLLPGLRQLSQVQGDQEAPPELQEKVAAASAPTN